LISFDLFQTLNLWDRLLTSCAATYPSGVLEMVTPSPDRHLWGCCRRNLLHRDITEFEIRDLPNTKALAALRFGGESKPFLRGRHMERTRPGLCSPKTLACRLARPRYPNAGPSIRGGDLNHISRPNGRTNRIGENKSSPGHSNGNQRRPRLRCVEWVDGVFHRYYDRAMIVVEKQGGQFCYMGGSTL
jgi:hypothetical protein